MSEEQEEKIVEVFVFGSNMSGIHGAGAAKFAYENKRAKWGIGEGFTGDCYALPTKGYNIEQLTLDEVMKPIKTFLSVAKFYNNYRFKVTRVGCGLGGFKDKDIAPLFKNAPENCCFDEEWKPYLGDTFKYWGTFPCDQEESESTTE